MLQNLIYGWRRRKREKEAFKAARSLDENPKDPDSIVKLAIATGRLHGAKTAREAAEMLMGREMTDAEWMKYRGSWERNW